MSFNQKIDEWIKEAEERPESALTLLCLIAGRLLELTERNEELLAENILSNHYIGKGALKKADQAEVCAPGAPGITRF